MSPASKSKSKPAARAAKEQSKVPSKASPSPSNGNGIPASAYNPISGTFHSLEMVPPASAPSPQNNGRFRTIDETEDHSGSSFGTTAEFDSLSNNGSCSGESEDQKDKAAPTPLPRTDSIPGADADKRDKIRQKNEKKHQRQRERRAQDVHDRCKGYLMSRKLEALSQQLVGMGFPLDRATMALMLNEGRLEQSVAWLFEGCEEDKQQVTANLDSNVNLKLDIADELARIAEMEVQFKCTKLDVERAVVGTEGDLERAAANLKLQAQKQESTSGALVKTEDLGGTASANGCINKVMTSTQNPSARTPGKGAAPASNQQQRRDERDFNYTKAVPASAMPEEVTSRILPSFQALRRIQAKPDWARSQVAATLEKRWPSTSASPSVSYSLASPLQVAVPPVKSEARFAMLGNEVKTTVQTGTLREPVIVMQRPQSMNGKQGLPLGGIGMNGGSIPASTGWHPNDSPGLEMMANGAVAGQHSLPKLSANGTSGQPYYPQSGFQPFILNPVESGGTGRVGARSATGTSSSTSASSTSLTIPSSLGLFTGWGSSGSSGSSSPVDWSTGSSVLRFDYTSIDWSLDPIELKTERPSSMRSPSVGIKPSRPSLNFVGLQDANGFLVDPSATVGVGSHEWTSPFAGKDLFRVPRQFVTSPSLQELGATWKA
ncbi:putative UBA-like superfamily, Ubiquitin-associated domain-containing protein [Dioscorea sansibarensis]